MAKPLSKRQLDDNWRKNIQTTKIINRLVDHVNGDAKMNPSQIRAAEILLRKTVPDLARQEVVGNDERPIETLITWKWPGSETTDS